MEAVAHPALPSQAHVAVIELARVIRNLESFTGAFGDWPNVAPSLMKAIQDASVFSHSAAATETIPSPTLAVSPPLSGDDAQSADGAPQPPVRENRSTEKGEAEAKLIAALALRHKYSDGSCLNLEPVKNNAVAGLAGVDQGSAPHFFKTHFRGRPQYVRICEDPASLSRMLGSLVGDMPAWKLFGRARASEGGRAEDEWPAVESLNIGCSTPWLSAAGCKCCLSAATCCAATSVEEKMFNAGTSLYAGRTSRAATRQRFQQ